MKRYVVAYITRRNHCDWPHSKTIEASNAKEAREKFDGWYWTATRPHPFHVTVKLFDGLTRCPLCHSWMEEQNDPDMAYVCLNTEHCGLKINRKVEF